MKRTKTNFLTILIILISVSGCTPPLLQCLLNFSDFERTYEFDFSKEELKNRILETYTYDKSVLLKNFGLTLIENEAVNSEYRQSVDIWLDKQNWDEVKSEIRNNTSDTLNLLISKHQSWTQIKLVAILNGDGEKSRMTISNVEFKRRKACDEDKEYYKIRVSDKIDKKLIRKLE